MAAKKKIGMTEQQRLGNGRPKADLGNHTNVNPDCGLGRFQHLLYTNHYKQIVLIIDIYTHFSICCTLIVCEESIMHLLQCSSHDGEHGEPKAINPSQPTQGLEAENQIQNRDS